MSESHEEWRARFDAEWRRMREEHLRLTLMLHGTFIRAITLFEVERDGLKKAKARSELFDERFRKYVESLVPVTPQAPTDPPD